VLQKCLEELARYKHSSLLGPYEENEVFDTALVLANVLKMDESQKSLVVLLLSNTHSKEHLELFTAKLTSEKFTLTVATAEREER